ncbi:protein-glutamine gamma-glutamyltransferase k [Plakobranchus ocellatus]|uniref:Protein-glutamine gamma-glutamyltransferase k n=1 Tax=Plakobranchus ocellatus TaxID=259542 RepID=A0AAV4C230_9GAST|nr:protein-glutamine gamma-glutamyltransferase k [Plakobranchus ocellatus]
MTRATSTRRPRNSSGSGNDASSSRPPKLRRLHYFTRSRAKRAALLGGDQEGRNNLLSDEEVRNRTGILKPLVEEHSKALGVTGVDFNKVKNGQEHHTAEYELSDLVVRRGQPFTLTIKTDRAADATCDIVVVQFTFGTRPQGNKGTLLRLVLGLSTDAATLASPMTGNWTARAGKRDNSGLEVIVSPSPTALVGKYGVFIETMLKDDRKSKRRFEMEDEDVFVIFNPWCQEDVVYMADPDERFEYVLNDRGRIWVGSAFNNCGRPWNFGQFDNPVLEAALHLMDLAEIMDAARKSPVAFIRAISALANSCDDNGVLEGRWTKEYPKDCTVPWAWTGSVKIIAQFMETGKSVCFGQCWVFSGLVTSCKCDRFKSDGDCAKTDGGDGGGGNGRGGCQRGNGMDGGGGGGNDGDDSVLRSVGIPTRSVTNFESAHDTDCSMTIDTHFDEDDEPVTWRDDSVWNFHVWNESYFRRLDLPQGYDGWQAHDATPQETSEGVMRCGPAPVRAIKEGHVYLNYDTSFIFSEVNGDKITWKVSEDGDMEVIDVDPYSVGKNISTKAVGSIFRHDLTSDYKYPDGSPEERKVVAFVNQCGTRAEYMARKTAKDVEFKIVIQEGAVLGQDFQIAVKLKNKSEQLRHIRGRLTVLSSFYTGVPGKRIKGNRFDTEVQPNQESDLTLEIHTRDYLSKLNPEASLQVYVSLNVDETGQHYARSQAFTLAKPFLTITVSDVIRACTNAKGVVRFTNPLSVNLTNASFSLEGASVMSADVYVIPNPIKPGEEVTHEFTLCPRRAGTREIDATFTSDQLSGVDGSVEFEVQPEDESNGEQEEMLQ